MRLSVGQDGAIARERGVKPPAHIGRIAALALLVGCQPSRTAPTPAAVPACPAPAVDMRAGP